MTVVHYEQPPPLPASRPGDETAEGPRGDVARLRAAAEYANYIADTEFVPADLRNRPAAIAAAMLYGAEVGFTPMQSLRSIAVIKGRPSLTAEAQRALVLAAGHELWFDESTTTRAIAAGRRSGEERIGRITFTADDAKRAGLAGQPNYQRYPAEMLRARASAALARALFADVIGGMPAAEEIDDSPDNGPQPIPPPSPGPPPPADVELAPEAKKTRTRKRAPAREPVAPTPPPDPQPEPEVPPEPLATDAQKRQLFALIRDVGIGQAGDEDAKRAERLEYTSAVVGRQIASSDELTIGEASKLIEALKALAERKSERNEQEVIETMKTDLDAELAAEPGEAVPYNEFPPGY